MNTITFLPTTTIDTQNGLTLQVFIDNSQLLFNVYIVLILM